MRPGGSPALPGGTTGKGGVLLQTPASHLAFQSSKLASPTHWGPWNDRSGDLPSTSQGHRISIRNGPELPQM